MRHNKKQSENWKIPLILFLSIIFLFAAVLFFFQTSKIPERPGYLKINNKTMICNYYYLCFLKNGTWHRPGYNAGTNLILANDLKVENESMIKKFFESKKINIVVNTTEQRSSENAELILRVTPFSNYLSYYYNRIRGENKIIEPYILSQYNSTEPAIIILGPGLGAEKDSIEFDGKNIIVEGQSSDKLSLILGKLLLIIVS